MRGFWIALALVGFPAGAFSLPQNFSFGCSEAGSGKTVDQTITTSNKLLPRMFVVIHARNLAGMSSDPKAAYTCEIHWQVFSAADLKQPMLDYSETNDHDEIGVSFIGQSPDGTKLLLSFWTAAGDFGDERPAVYDLVAHKGTVRHLGDRILANLPGGCDYSNEVAAVRNDGRVVVVVPAIDDDPRACPGAGEWLLDMKADSIARATSAGHSDML